VVKNINAEFLGFAVLGDMLKVKTEVLQKKRVSVLLEQQIFKDNKKIFTMEILLVYVKEAKPSAIPKELQSIFKENLIY
jgi:acyl-CoA thioester hydrolase